MITQEVQIGDWVHYKVNLGSDCFYEKDVQIANIYGNEINCEVSEYEIISGKRLSNCEPIPLTAEILEKNGFVLKPDGWIWFEDEGNEYQNYVFIQFRKGCEGIRHCEINFINKSWCLFKNINFVHELQQTLRICKVNKEIKL